MRRQKEVHFCINYIKLTLNFIEISKHSYTCIDYFHHIILMTIIYTRTMYLDTHYRLIALMLKIVHEWVVESFHSAYIILDNEK